MRLEKGSFNLSRLEGSGLDKQGFDPREFGFSEGINEVIGVTCSKKDVLNAAPLGIHMRGGRVFVRVFPSQSLENLRETGVLTASITLDPRIFVRTALSSLPPDEFRRLERGGAVLQEAVAWVHFRAELETSGKPAVFRLTPLSGGTAGRGVSAAVNRGFNALIEGLVHATRYRVFRRERELECVRYYSTIVRKCGRPVDLEALELLWRFLELEEKL